MAIETGIIVGGVSIISLIVTKFKCFVRRNGHLSWGIGFLNKPLLDNDELEVKEFDLGEIRGIYVKPKGSYHLQQVEENHD